VRRTQTAPSIGMNSYVRYPERPLMAATRLTNSDFAQWGRSFGAEGITIKSEAEVADGIARGAASRRAATATGARRFAVD
jgi:thiamine pyrophosphate-dependent acetolactate synthase large subunit-like protein